MARVLIAGCGYVGAALASELAAAGDDVFGLSRQPVSLPDGVHPVRADLTAPATLAALPADLDFVFYLASPGGADEALYRAVYVEGLSNLTAALARQGQQPDRIFFASSTSVYAQSEGEWVDEKSATQPSHYSGQRLLEAEAVLAAAPFPGTVVRFAGIYGPQRTRLVDDVRSGRAVVRESPPQWTNRIHRDDCAGLLKHLRQLRYPERVYLGVDCEPALQSDVQRWLATALGAPPPRAAPAGDAAVRASGGNKRCRNARVLASGYHFRHPSYREGYRAVLDAMV